MKKLDKRYLLVTYFLFVYGLVLGQINNNIQNQYTYKIQQEIDFISQKVQDLGIVNLKLGNINLSKVCYKGKCGLYNLSLKKWVLPLQFEKIESATDSMLVIKMDNNRARIFHLNPKSAFNLRCEYPVGAKKKFILLREGHSDSRIYFPNSKKTINLPYSFTSILDDSMIMVNNFGAVNIVDLNGVVRLKRDYRDIRIMDNKYYGGMSDHKGENKIYFELNMKKGTEYYDTIYDFNCMKLYKDKISKKYNLKLTCNSISQIIELNIDTFFYSVSQLLIGEKSGNYFLLDYLSNNRMYPFYYDAVVNKRIEYDSISISGHRSVQLFKNGKMGLIYRDIKMNLVEPKYEYIALFGFDGTHLSMRYFIKEGNKISIYNLNGDLIKICDCENPVIGSTDEPSTSNVVLCFGKNGIIKVYNINGEVISLSKVNFQDEQNDKFNITSLSDNTVVKVGKKFGLISKNKNILVPFKYNRLKKTIYKGIYIAYEEAFKEEIVSLIDINRNIKKQYKGYALMLNDNNKYFELLANRKTFYNFYIDSISLELKPLKDFAEIFNNKSIILDKAGKYGMESNDIKTIIEFKYKYGYKLQAFHLAF
ncbi:MAG: hypothetical protein IPL63_06085 [Saprospiraceae bacterium]|nr:hypothetical protein [Saprospiraceae bacterium]